MRSVVGFVGFANYASSVPEISWGIVDDVKEMVEEDDES